MGRRSMKTTKGGRFMNPTDQARKEARRKELKKNKKQRLMVREAVIKSKEPRELLRELEELEQQDVESSLKGLPNEKGIKERKKKLQDTVQRLQAYWEKESPAQYHELKRLVRESEERRRRLKQTYAFSSSIADTAEQKERLSLIPLPTDSVPPVCTDTLPEDIPLPEPEPLLPPAILKPPHSHSDTSRYPYPVPAHLIQERNAHLPRRPPGPPPGLPPALLGKQRLLGLTEIDLLNRPAEKKVSFAPNTEIDEANETDNQSTQPTLQYNLLPSPAPFLPSTGTSSVPPAPPPFRSPFLIPGQSHSSTTPLKASGLQPHIQASAVLNTPHLSATPTAPMHANLSSRISNPLLPSSIISAKPQLRNTYAEVTKFVPTSIRVRRDAASSQAVASVSNAASLSGVPSSHSYGLTYNENKPRPVRTQDEAYSDFMKEMELLL